MRKIAQKTLLTAVSLSTALFPLLTHASTYHYNHTNQRVLHIDGENVIYTPNKHFERRGVTTTKHIYIGNTIVATIETDEDGNDAKHFVHTDHLGGTNVVSNEEGAVEQVLDYYPYGTTRINEQNSHFDQTNKFTGYELDGTGLQYAGQRYYDGSTGQFNSQDPAYLDIGDSSFEDSYQRSLRQHLSNPQALNSYSYSHNNPVVLKDEEGEVVPLLLAAWAVTEIALSAYDVYDVYKTLSDPSASDTDKSFSVSGALIGLGTVGGGYGKAGKKGFQVFDSVVDAIKTGDYTQLIAGVDVRDFGRKVKGSITDLRPTLERIKKGVRHPHPNDGTIFRNDRSRLPAQDVGYYREYVHPTPGIRHAGPERVIGGQGGELFYSPDHYGSFLPLNNIAKKARRIK